MQSERSLITTASGACSSVPLVVALNFNLGTRGCLPLEGSPTFRVVSAAEEQDVSCSPSRVSTSEVERVNGVDDCAATEDADEAIVNVVKGL